MKTFPINNNYDNCVIYQYDLTESFKNYCCSIDRIFVRDNDNEYVIIPPFFYEKSTSFLNQSDFLKNIGDGIQFEKRFKPLPDNVVDYVLNSYNDDYHILNIFYDEIIKFIYKNQYQLNKIYFNSDVKRIIIQYTIKIDLNAVWEDE